MPTKTEHFRKAFVMVAKEVVKQVPVGEQDDEYERILYSIDRIKVIDIFTQLCREDGLFNYDVYYFIKNHPFYEPTFDQEWRDHVKLEIFDEV